MPPFTNMPRAGDDAIHSPRRLIYQIILFLLFLVGIDAFGQSSSTNVKTHWDNNIQINQWGTLQIYDTPGDNLVFDFTNENRNNDVQFSQSSCKTNIDDTGLHCGADGPLSPPWGANCRHACDIRIKSSIPGTHTIRIHAGETTVFVDVDFHGSVYLPVDPAKSSAAVLTNGQLASGTHADVLQATIKDSNGSPASGVTATFAATAGVTFTNAIAGQAGSCVTNTQGQCSVNAFSNNIASYSTQVSANGSVVGTLGYNFVAGQLSLYNSVYSLTTNNQPANGTAANILDVTTKDVDGHPISGISISFSATPNVGFNGAATGAAASCISDSNGKCTLRLTSIHAGTYSTQAKVNSMDLGTRTYTFVAGTPSASHSGVRVVIDNATGGGAQADVLEVLVRDAYDNPVGGALVGFGSAGADVKFGAAPAGTAGSCSSAAGTGLCQVSATSSNAAGGSKNSVVSLGGSALSGSFNVAGVAYGKSPAVFSFTSAAARLQIVKQVVGASGSHTFVFDIVGMPTTTDSITVAGSGSASGAVMQAFPAARAITITEVASSAWPEAPTGASCVDLASATPTATFGTLLGYQLLIPASHTGLAANLRCTFVNTRAAEVSGRIFNDTGIGSGTPNDGVINGREDGLAGVGVVLGDCGSVVHASAMTDSAGHYSLTVPAALADGAPLCVSTGQNPARHATGGSMANTPLPSGIATVVNGTSYTYTYSRGTDRIAFAWAGSSADGLNFASVPRSSFRLGSLLTGRPGTVVTYGHVFVAGTAGSLGFSVIRSASTPPFAGWSQKVFADPLCTGQLQPGATLLFPGTVKRSVTAGEVVCVLLQDAIPAQAPQGTQDDVTLQAALAFTNANPALTATYLLDDATTVSDDALALLKEVRNVSQNVGTFGASNQARPGETLEYRITFTNQAPEPVSKLQIHDTTPAFTSFLGATAGSTPTTISSCTKTTPASSTPVDCALADTPGGHGPVEWVFNGNLAPGGSGSVLFRVRMD